MKKPTTRRPLRLATTTLRKLTRLGDDQLAGVAGGTRARYTGACYSTECPGTKGCATN